ncbi:NAD-dependent epimerase/dehydratase family protein [Vibrio kyushuensis]|uniref:NAD-dependent epimerase/dehydratase family protein n=1 Tax=Vibrio kyushuensis TaxID=2910249 RepID=UPI003D0DAA33
MKILVTGSSGFIGGKFVELAESQGDTCIKQVRTPKNDQKGTYDFVAELASETDWSTALEGVKCVVHCAALVHQTQVRCPLDLYRKSNTQGTIALANQAAENGVEHFVFLSSIKVNGECTEIGHPFTASVKTPPIDPYGLSKFEAEIALKEIYERTGMKVTIIRPPLVYGPGVKANFRSMLKILHKGIPLPLRNTRNHRSLVYVGNLVDLLWQCTRKKNSGCETYLVSDGTDVSTSQLLVDIGEALGKPAKLLPFPAWVIKLGTSIIGKSGISERLYGNLQVDISETTNRLDWVPPYKYKDALRSTVKHYVDNLKINK